MSLSRGRGPGTIADLSGNGWRGLAAAVVWMAVDDYLCRGTGPETFIEREGFHSITSEVQGFWYSRWGRYLREYFGIETLTLVDIRRMRENAEIKELELNSAF